MTAQLGTLRSPSAATGGDTVLRRLRRYLQLHRQATLGDLALHFDVPAEAMRGMLEGWLRKGRVRELDAQATCNTSCATACDDTAMTIYEWVEPTAPAGFTPLAVIGGGSDGGACRHRA
jgi:hypothetical protein